MHLPVSTGGWGGHESPGSLKEKVLVTPCTYPLGNKITCCFSGVFLFQSFSKAISYNPFLKCDLFCHVFDKKDFINNIPKKSLFYYRKSNLFSYVIYFLYLLKNNGCIKTHFKCTFHTENKSLKMCMVLKQITFLAENTHWQITLFLNLLPLLGKYCFGSGSAEANSSTSLMLCLLWLLKMF